VYSNGSVTFEHSFPEPGKFVGLVTIRGGTDEYVSRFPFAVGAGGKSNLPYIIGAIVLAAAGAFFFMRSKKNKTEAA
jgi:LPXTG-motif cell wall-anchored protein